MFKTVPIEPTEAMIEAFWGKIQHGDEERAAAIDAYREMLAAAPPAECGVVYQVKKEPNAKFSECNKATYDDMASYDTSRVRILFTAPRVVDEALRLLLGQVEQCWEANHLQKSPSMAYAVNKAKAALEADK